MENVNLHEIRSKLKHGDIAIIANRCGTTTRQVSEVLNKGRDANGRYSEIVESALDLLKNEAEGRKTIVAKAKEAGFSTSSFSRSLYKPKRKINKAGVYGRRKGGIPVVLYVGVLGVIAFFLLGGSKLLSGTQTLGRGGVVGTK